MPPPAVAAPAGTSRLPGPQPATALAPALAPAPASVPASAPALVVARALPAGHATSAPSASSALSASPGPAAPPSPATARLLQRVAEQTGLTGVPMTAVPARTPTTVQLAGPARTATPGTPPAASTPGKAPAGPGAERRADPADLDELARRLVEPVGRLLRTELRRGRERSGKPYDMRR
ncbi:hypothetical protein ACFWJ4_40105 [Kitasatospora sp. NPDC127067]|uniref:hypothetical protein n=1 Tax=Kitasatospora sp. NPDC127067 TaxID=3347126 RepID=UPI00364F58D4